MKKRLLAWGLCLALMLSLLPGMALAVEEKPDGKMTSQSNNMFEQDLESSEAGDDASNENNNNQTVPHEEWTYTPGTYESASTTSHGVSLQNELGDTDNAADTVKVHVTATDRNISETVPVPDAEVKLYVGSELVDTAIADENGDASISLAGLSLVERRNATISASKIVSRGTAIDGDARDDLFQYFPKDEDGEYYRYTLELHSESIDSNGNWCGAELPISYESNKADIVFAIDATGSMSDEINNVKTNIAAFAENLISSGLDIRFSIIEYRDITEGEETIIHTRSGSHWMTDIGSVVDTLQSIDANGGGDEPETVLDALGYVADNELMNWRSDAYRFAFVLTDSNYKINNNYDYANVEDLAAQLSSMNVVTSVITSSSYFSAYEWLYDKTGGIYANINSSSFDQEMMNLSNSIIASITREMTLTLSEPRLLVNMSVCYYADDKNSQSTAYQNGVKNMLNEYANRVAETTDGHILIDQVILFSTANRLDFYDTMKPPSMADIRIETEEKDDGTWWSNVQIHSNAYIGGFFSDGTYVANYDGDSTEHFTNLKDGEDLDGRRSFYRIQLSGTEGAGWNNSMLDDAYAYSTTVTHEAGHYLMCFFDEYLNADKEDWREVGGKPYTAFGLMDNQHYDIEMSKDPLDYAYAGGDISSLDKSQHTYQSYRNGMSCESFLEALLINDSFSDVYEQVTEADFDRGIYQATYTKVSDSDYHASYSYAGLSDSDFLTVPVSFFGDIGNATWNLGATPWDAAGSEAVFTQNKVVAVEWTGTTDAGVTLSLAPVEGYTYGVAILKPDVEDYTDVELMESGTVLTATLPIAKDELAEVRVVADNGESAQYNTYYVDRSGDTDTGYIYTSADNAVMAYVTTSNEESSYMFIADNTGYSNGDYLSVNQATKISSDDNAGFESGEIYSVADYLAEIDYSTLSWFKYANGKWTQLQTDYSQEENMNIGARTNLDGEGLYVLMAKKASVGGVDPARNLTYIQSTDRDAVVTLSFEDSNENSKYYNIYYSEEPFIDKNADSVVVRSFNADATNLTLNLIERNRIVYASVEIVLEDGSRSELSDQIRLEAGEADSDGDGIPDWYCDKYGLWPKNGEEKDIANSDDDGDGLTNLEEYRGGSDPTNPNDPEHTTNVPVESITVSESKITLPVGESTYVTATVLPGNATNKAVNWTSKDPSIAAVNVEDGICEITAIKEGSTEVYAVTQDGGFSSAITVTVSKYTITYTDGVDDVEVFADQVYTVALGDETPKFVGTPNRTGYTFVGWTPTVTETVNGTVVYTAKWIPKDSSSGGSTHVDYAITIEDYENGSVKADEYRASRGETITLIVSPDEGYALANLAVTDASGDAVTLTNAGSGQYTFVMPASEVTVSATFTAIEQPAAEPFTDVDETDWFYDEVVYVYANGLMDGVGGNRFAPDTVTNRAMLATILYRLAGEPDVSGDLPFTDVAAGQWYTDAVLWAAQNGIVNGVAEGIFAPMNTLTREQLVTMLYRYAEAEGYDVSAAADLSGYPDAGKVLSYAQKAMSWAVAEGIVAGMDDGTLNPAGNATRAQIATILMRFCEGVAQ